MKKIINSLLVLTALSILMVSCGSSSSSPDAVVKEFFNKLSKKDIDGAAKLATKESKATLDMMKKGIEAAEKMKEASPDEKEKDFAEEFKNIEYGAAKITGETAIVTIKNSKEKDEQEIHLKKEDGAWKVDFSMSALRKMDKDGMDVKDEEVSMEEMQKGMEAMDSLMKNMDPQKAKELKESMEKMKEQ